MINYVSNTRLSQIDSNGGATVVTGSDRPLVKLKILYGVVHKMGAQNNFIMAQISTCLAAAAIKYRL